MARQASVLQRQRREMSTNANPIIYLPPSLTSNQDAGEGRGFGRLETVLPASPTDFVPARLEDTNPTANTNEDHHLVPTSLSSSNLIPRFGSQGALENVNVSLLAPPGYGYVQQAAYLVDRKVRWG